MLVPCPTSLSSILPCDRGKWTADQGIELCWNLSTPTGAAHVLAVSLLYQHNVDIFISICLRMRSRKHEGVDHHPHHRARRRGHDDSRCGNLEGYLEIDRLVGDRSNLFVLWVGEGLDAASGALCVGLSVPPRPRPAFRLVGGCGPRQAAALAPNRVDQTRGQSSARCARGRALDHGEPFIWCWPAPAGVPPTPRQGHGRRQPLDVAPGR